MNKETEENTRIPFEAIIGYLNDLEKENAKEEARMLQAQEDEESSNRRLYIRIDDSNLCHITSQDITKEDLELAVKALKESIADCSYPPKQKKG